MKITDTDTSEVWDVKNVDDIKAVPDEVRQRLWKQFGRAVQSSPDPKVQENWVSVSSMKVGQVAAKNKCLMSWLEDGRKFGKRFFQVTNVFTHSFKHGEVGKNLYRKELLRSLGKKLFLKKLRNGQLVQALDKDGDTVYRFSREEWSNTKETTRQATIAHSRI